jgi:transcriptional regulator with XRE-family HTH domain
MDVHDKIKVMRLFKNLTQEEMAQKLGYSSTQGYSKIERGESDPTLGKLEEISQVLGISLQDLLGLNENNVVHIAGNCQYIRHNSSPNVTLTLVDDTQLANELEQTRLLLQERDKEVAHLKNEINLLKEFIELMKLQQKTVPNN